MSKRQYYSFLRFSAKIILGDSSDTSETEIDSVDSADEITEEELALMNEIFNQVSLYIREDNWQAAMHLISQHDYGVNILDDVGNAPLHVAIMNGRVDAVRDLLSLNADANLTNLDGETSLHMAAYNGRVDLVRMLLDRGADLNLLDDNENNALHYATMNYNSFGAEATVEFLLSRGMNPDIRNNQGNTALYYAADSGDVTVIKSLLRLMADVNIQNDDGNTPLHIAAMNGNIDAVILLVRYGVSFVANNAGDSAADLAATDEIRDFIYQALVDDLRMTGDALMSLIYEDCIISMSYDNATDDDLITGEQNFDYTGNMLDMSLEGCY
ncbi:MAG: ankyrin repeat domain-containing protein [Rickettsiales bacterium]|jgi:ankyrin repeat protein|nr:ankyrin repeat domain-containing protein [Rickettsiales bacterium]